MNTNSDATITMQHPPIKQNFFSIIKNYTSLEVQGANSKKMLHDLTTINLDQVNECQFGALCNAKGQVISNIWLIPQDELGYLLRLPLEMATTVSQHLAKYSRLYQVEINDLTNICNTINIISDKQLIELIPTYEKTITYSHPIIPNCYEILSPELTIHNQIIINLAQHDLVELSEQHIDSLLNQYKLITINPQISAKYTPNHLEYENFNGISFNKGCYLGQEIIARIKYKTTLKTQLQKHVCQLPTKPIIGEPLIIADDNLGVILNATLIQANEWIIITIKKS